MSFQEQRNSIREQGTTGANAQIVPAISEWKHGHSVFRRRKRWIPMPFGKYRRLTMPQVLFTDPDYFFWLRGVLKGALPIESEQLARKVCRIRIPKEPSEAFVAHYFFELEGQFVCYRAER
jgi:hypothetical protein